MDNDPVLEPAFLQRIGLQDGMHPSVDRSWPRLTVISGGMTLLGNDVGSSGREALSRYSVRLNSIAYRRTPATQSDVTRLR